MGDRAGNLERAARILDAHPQVDVVACSRVVSTAAAGGVARRGFLNAVVLVDTSLAPADLLALCRRAEARIGRRPTRRWADRIVDIDLLLYGDRVIVGKALNCPHPALGHRDFVLQPLLEVWPAATDPWTGGPLPRPSRRLPVTGTLPRPS